MCFYVSSTFSRHIYLCFCNILFSLSDHLRHVLRLSYILLLYRSFSSDVTAAILVYQNNEMAAILVYGTGISSFLFKYFVLFHHPTGATDHVSENDLYTNNRYPIRSHHVALCYIIFSIQQGRRNISS